MLRYIPIFIFCLLTQSLFASSHREAPLIANDPLADNTDLYAFRSPDNPNTVTIIANYVPLQLPHGGPNYYSFGKDVRYEIHIDNNINTTGDDIIYRFTFTLLNEVPNTFFNIRQGENLRTTYVMERSLDGGNTFATIISNGKVPPPNIGPRSINSVVGLGADSYQSLVDAAIENTNTGEKVFCGTVDDPFFVDLGGIFDLGDAPRQGGGIAQDGVACMNVSTIAIQIPINILLNPNASPTPSNILDENYVIGVWASASRQKMRTLSKNQGISYTGDWIQVSRLGMPLTNEAVIPIGQKDFWNALSPYDEINETTLDENFYNPELALYMDESPGKFGAAVPAFSPLRIQRNSLQTYGFGNGQNGLYPLKGSSAVAGTALDDAIAGTLLLPAPNKPRSVDLWPIFHTGVPNLEPYQLATGKNGNPLATGKPFIHNFLPNGGDMLRLNMAVPVTDRNSSAFNSLGLVQAAVLGLTDPQYANPNLQFIPNMDGFPNGRRLEDDVTRIELQAVAGVVLAAIGLWYDDYTAGDPNPVTEDLLNVLTYSTGVESNERPFTSSFPYMAIPHRGTDGCVRGALPLKLTVFNGYTKQNSNRLEWVTATEQNIQWHIIERSADGKSDWIEVGRVPSQGPAAHPQFYELEDKKPLTAAYYRLHSLHTDAKSQYSTQVFLQRKESTQLTVQPNPVRNQFELVGQFGATEIAYLVVTNVLGEVIHHQQLTLNNGHLTHLVDSSNWTSGLYFINILNNGQRTVQKVEVVK